MPIALHPTCRVEDGRGTRNPYSNRRTDACRLGPSKLSKLKNGSACLSHA